MSIKENLEKIGKRMAAAARRAGRNPDSVRLLAVTKRVGAVRIKEAVNSGQRLFGENYVQEAQGKIPLFGREINWHFIGHLQSNKVKAAGELFQVIESVDRLKLAAALNRYLTAVDETGSLLVQVNIGREPQKAGVLPEKIEELLRALVQFEHLKITGLMAMPPFLDSLAVRVYFRRMRQLADDLTAKGLLGRENGRVELSMGMSRDFEIAIEEGATLVRIGTGIFGSRV